MIWFSSNMFLAGSIPCAPNSRITSDLVALLNVEINDSSNVSNNS